MCFLTKPDARVLEISVHPRWFGASGTVHLVLRNPDGKEVSKTAVAAKKELTLKQDVSAEHAGKAWSLELAESDRGQILRMTHVTLGAGCGRLIATHPARLLTESHLKD